MPGALLRSKLFAPPLRSESVPRERLLAALESGRSRKLTLVSAPAGFGKSTLVAAWAARQSRVAWLSLDADDNDCHRFLRYLVAAMEKVAPAAATALTELLNAPQLPDAETLVARLTAEMHENAPFLLVLDDYHAITDPEIHAFVETLLAYQPRSLHLVLVTREDPPLPLTRLRARGELNEIRAQELRFTVAEARAFLNETMGLRLSQAQINTLTARTEGWIVGLQLAALSLQRSDDADTLVAAFAGDDRYVLDYLLDEVFARQPEPVQQFLLQTSVLERLKAELCAAVVDSDSLTASEVSSLLPELERSNLFILPLDNRRQWYRYHHLFADLLRYRLQRQRPEQVPRLHRRASVWYEENGYLSEAVDHALAAGDHPRVADLIEAHGSALFAASEMRALLNWFKALPDALVTARPRLLMILAWTALATGHREQAEGALDQIEKALGVGMADLDAPDSDEMAEQTRAALAEIAVTRAVLAYGRGDSRRTVALCRSALPHLKAEAARGLFHAPLELRSVAFFNLGVAQQMEGAVVPAAEAFREAVAVSRRCGNLHTVALATGHLGQTLVLRGQLHEAETVYREALAGAETSATPYRSLAHAGLGTLLYEWNELAAARRHLEAAISLGGPLGNWESVVPAYTGLAQLFQAQEQPEQALGALAELEALRRDFGLAEAVPTVAALRARLWLRQANLAAASRWAQEVHSSLPESAGGAYSLAQETEALALVRILVAQEQVAEAMALIAPLLDQAEAAGRNGRVLELLLLHALALDAAGRREQALRALSSALLLGRAEGYVRLFLDEGEPLARLLYAAVEAGLNQTYAGRLLDAVTFVNDEPGPDERLVEPLTEREQEVLGLVAQGLTNREIGQELSIALGTVKVHTYNIYGKLGAGNRTEAVARAQALGIL